MVSVADELKRKMAEIDDRLVCIRAEVATLEAQKAAMETVVAIYDPSFKLATPSNRAKADRSTPSKRITDMLKGKDLRGGILITLRDAESPLRATEIAKRFVVREGLEEKADGLSAGLAGRFSNMLDRLGKDGLIRFAGESNHRVWEIAR